jgi:hypothetical protein
MHYWPGADRWSLLAEGKECQREMFKREEEAKEMVAIC